MALTAKSCDQGRRSTPSRDPTHRPSLVRPTYGPDVPPDSSRCKSCRKLVSGTSEDPKIVVQKAVSGSVYCKACCGGLVPADPIVLDARKQIQDVLDGRPSLPPMITDENFQEYRKP